jgi:hypothetical protein
LPPVPCTAVSYGGFMRRFHRDKKGHVEVACFNTGPYEEIELSVYEKEKKHNRENI